ncbi:MAG: hypothetical protein AAF211_19260, partial [Myxococcota bacterium]
MFTVALTVLSGSLPARAHHDSAVQQIGSTGTAPSTASLLKAASRIEAKLGVSWQSFGRLREAGRHYERAEPKVTVERYTLAAGARLASRTRLDLVLPVGRIRGETPSAFGLGDVGGSVTQELGPLRLGVLGTAPTGRYTVDAVSSVVDVQPDADGNLGIRTYDARASLGSGTWRTGLTAGLRGRTQSITGDLTATVVQPIGRTPDGIRWGTDLWLRGTISVRALSDRLAVGGGLLGQLHTADRLDGEVDATIGIPTL